jgi:hypothetical protein
MVVDGSLLPVGVGFEFDEVGRWVGDDDFSSSSISFSIIVATPSSLNVQVEECTSPDFFGTLLDSTEALDGRNGRLLRNQTNAAEIEVVVLG